MNNVSIRIEHYFQSAGPSCMVQVDIRNMNTIFLQAIRGKFISLINVQKEINV